MIRDMKSLLLSHKVLLSRQAAIQARLVVIESSNKRQLEQKISEMSLGRGPMDGLPKPENRGSITEYVALHYQEEFNQTTRAEVAQLRAELDSVEYNLSIYRAGMASMNELEQAFIRLHYDEQLSYVKLATRMILPGDPNTQLSVSTLKRMNHAVLEKLSMALGPQIPCARICGF